MGVLSSVLGVCSLVFPFIGLGWLSALLGIAGFILGILSRKNMEENGIATAGIIMCIVAVTLGLLSWITCAACVGGLASLGNSL